jgi:hypothetical protein
MIGLVFMWNIQAAGRALIEAQRSDEAAGGPVF